jgi:arylsulfate sulfotransferase
MKRHTAALTISAVAVAFLYARGATAHAAGCTVSLQVSKPSPQAVGERIVWTATAANCGTTPVYQFSVAGRSQGKEREEADHERARREESEHERGRHQFAMVRDYSLDASFAWAPMQEGAYDVRVRVKDGFDGAAVTSTVVSDRVSSRVTGDDAVVTPTLNPLVALYSAPPCDEGRVRVRFRPAGGPPDARWTRTSALSCVRGQSRNFLVAGMLANTTYEMVHVGGDEDASPVPLLFTTGTPPATLSIPAFTVRQAPAPGAELRRDVLYHNLAARQAANHVNLLASDLSGRLEWYYDPLASGLIAIGNSMPFPKGTVMLSGRDSHRTVGQDVMREIDLGGNPLRETNIDAVNAQLKARGQELIYGFHHEFLRLPNGNDIVTLGWTQRTIDVGGTPTRYAGDMLMVLDEDLQVVWTWDAFDHLDVNRAPILGELCGPGPCPLIGAVDWLHENAVSWSPADGNLLISVRHQDWVIKIDYARGKGDGHVIWRLGQGGDFAVISSDPSPWFSHQHYAHYQDDSTLLLFDNGNTRRASDPSAHSRGQVWRLDEEAMTATLVVNLDVGNYSPELGVAERMPNGNYVFDSDSQGGGTFGQSIEMLPDGNKVYVQEVAARDYRSFRMSNLYCGVRR